MAHVAKNDLHVRASIAGTDIREGTLVRLTASGTSDLPIALPAASSTHLNVYVAFFAPDDFARPTSADMYKASWYSVLDQSSWNEGVTGTRYPLGPSITENPLIASGYKMLARKGGIYQVNADVVVDNALAKIGGNLVKVASDGSGKWEYSATEADAIGKVVEFDSALGVYTFELGFDS